jgi:hypothetical protein
VTTVTLIAIASITGPASFTSCIMVEGALGLPLEGRGNKARRQRHEHDLAARQRANDRLRFYVLPLERTLSRSSRNSLGPSKRRRLRCCHSSSGAAGSISLSSRLLAKSVAFALRWGLPGPDGDPASACSTMRRIASGRDGLPSCRAIQWSRAASGVLCKRTKIDSPFPVAGEPLFFGFCDITD